VAASHLWFPRRASRAAAGGRLSKRRRPAREHEDVRAPVLVGLGRPPLLGALPEPSRFFSVAVAGPHDPAVGAVAAPEVREAPRLLLDERLEGHDV
jgi:hypothetical protein